MGRIPAVVVRMLLGNLSWQQQGFHNGKDSPRRRPPLSSGGGAVWCHRRSGAAQAAAGLVPPGQRRLHSGLPHYWCVAGRHGCRDLPGLGPWRVGHLLQPQGQRQRLGCLCRLPRLCAAVCRTGRAQGRGGRGPRQPGQREPAAALPERATQRGTVGGAHAGRGAVGGAGPHRDGKALWCGPGQRGLAQQQVARGV